MLLAAVFYTMMTSVHQPYHLMATTFIEDDCKSRKSYLNHSKVTKFLQDGVVLFVQGSYGA